MSSLSSRVRPIQNSTFKIQHLFSPTTLILIFLLLLSLITISIQHAHGAAITLAWDPNSPSENVAGYRLYYGNESRNYTAVIDITNGTLKKISKLEKGQLFYFAVTAYNNAGQESDFSEELMVNTCTYKLTPGRKAFKPEGGVATVKIVTQQNCEWTATSNADWLEIMDGHDGIGPGVITFAAEPNSTPETRIANAVFGGKNFSAKQKGATVP
jgi:hypothetical protein